MPEQVKCHKKSDTCNHVVIVGKYHYNAKKWQSYHNWEKEQRVAGSCPHCGEEVRKLPDKTEGDSIQFHKINFCLQYSYGIKSKGNKKKSKEPEALEKVTKPPCACTSTSWRCQTCSIPVCDFCSFDAEEGSKRHCKLCF